MLYSVYFGSSRDRFVRSKRISRTENDDDDDDEEDESRRRSDLSQTFARVSLKYMYVPVLMVSTALLAAGYLFTRNKVTELGRLGEMAFIRTYTMTGKLSDPKVLPIRDLRVLEETPSELVIAPVIDTFFPLPLRFRFDRDENVDKVKDMFSPHSNSPPKKLASSVGSISEEESIQFERTLAKKSKRRKTKDA